MRRTRAVGLLDKAARNAIRIGLFSCVLPAHAAELPEMPRTTMWEGRLSVHQQEGEGCSLQPSPPYVRRLTIRANLDEHLSGALFLSGEAQAMAAIGSQGQFNMHTLASSSRSTGEMFLRQDGAGLRGEWKESPSAQTTEECVWTLATVELQPLGANEFATAFALSQLTERAFRLADDKNSPDWGWSSAHWNDFASIGEALVGARVVDLSVAQLYLEEARAAHLWGRREQVASVMEIARELYRLVGPEHPGVAAAAFGEYAWWLRHQRRWTEAEAVYGEALSLLSAHGVEVTRAGADAHSGLGWLYLRLKRYTDSAKAFSRALEIHQACSSGAVDVAIAMNNLAQALGRQGLRDRAIALLDSALSILVRAGREDSDVAEVIIQNATSLREGLSAGSPVI